MKTFSFRSHNKKCRIQYIPSNAIIVWIGKKQISIPLQEIQSIYFSEILRERNRTILLHIDGAQKELLAVPVTTSSVAPLHRWLLSIPSLSANVHACPKQLQRVKSSRKNPLFILLLIVFLIIVAIFITRFFSLKKSTPPPNVVNNPSPTEFQKLFKEGVQCIEENHLTDGIQLLLEAKKIKATPEIEKILNDAYFERGEYFFQNSDFEKAMRDFESMTVLTQNAQKMIDQMKITHSETLPGIQVQAFQNQLRESYYLTFEEPKMVSTGNWVIDGQMFDDATQSELSCRLYLKNPQEVYRIIFQIDASKAQVTPQENDFTKLSSNYLSFASTLFRMESDPVKASEWVSKTVPKAKLPYVQFDNIFVNTGFRLYGEQYKRVLEVFVVSR
jgi:hypothetical protein